MSEESPKLGYAYRRSAIGLGIVAVGWTLAILLGRGNEESPMVWLIPIAAAALSVVCYSNARKAGHSPNSKN